MKKRQCSERILSTILEIDKWKIKQIRVCFIFKIYTDSKNEMNFCASETTEDFGSTQKFGNKWHIILCLNSFWLEIGVISFKNIKKLYLWSWKFKTGTIIWIHSISNDKCNDFLENYTSCLLIIIFCWWLMIYSSLKLCMASLCLIRWLIAIELELCVHDGTLACSPGNIGSAADRARSRWLEFLSVAFLLSN